MKLDPIECARTACIWEVTARKVGNVHPTARFHDLDHEDFLRSADALAETLVESEKLGVGETILRAVQKRITVTPSNTNLGIILLLVPLVKARDQASLGKLLAKLTKKDARFAYEAIRIASAGGLGDVPEQTVNEEPTVTLIDAMRMAAHRDCIARAYSTDYLYIEEMSRLLVRAFKVTRSVEFAIIECQMYWLAQFPDSLIARKCGEMIAKDVQHRAMSIFTEGGLETSTGRAAGVRFDSYLRSDGNRLNPGTTADLVTACLFIALRDGKLKPSDPFPWPVTDWL